MRRINQTLLGLLIAFLLVTFFHACNWPSDSGGDQEHPSQTQILDVKVQPDTVAPGDTASFTCVIKDSTDKRFKFYWYVDQGEVLNAELFDDNPVIYKTESNSAQWVAPSTAGFNSFTVLTDNGSNDSTSVDESFVIVVK